LPRAGSRKEVVVFRKKTIEDVDVDGKRVLVRVDFNVPLSDGQVADDTRIRGVLPTINYLRNHNAKIILMSHLGRPNGEVEEKLRLTPVAGALSQLLGVEVKKVDVTVSSEAKEAVGKLKEGEILLLENLRFNPGEKANDPEFARELAAVGDIYVDDAFGAAHRAHASTVGVTKYLPAVGGFLLEKEVKNLTGLLEEPERPFIAILGGNKVSDKIKVIEKFLEVVDSLLIGGGMSFTFLKAKGLNIGKSVCEDEELDHAVAMLEKAQQRGVPLYLPVDVVIADAISEEANHRIVLVEEMPSDWLGLDIGPETARIYSRAISSAKTIFWNGPLGVFEIDVFAEGTRTIAEAIVDNTEATSIIGGGDTDAAVRKFGLEDKISFVSTGGGASLKILEGTPLPGVEALMDK
jgi:phosphoglycerate kinase